MISDTGGGGAEIGGDASREVPSDTPDSRPQFDPRIEEQQTALPDSAKSAEADAPTRDGDEGRVSPQDLHTTQPDPVEEASPADAETATADKAGGLSSGAGRGADKGGGSDREAMDLGPGLRLTLSEAATRAVRAERAARDQAAQSRREQGSDGADAVAHREAAQHIPSPSKGAAPAASSAPAASAEITEEQDDAGDNTQEKKGADPSLERTKTGDGGADKASTEGGDEGAGNEKDGGEVPGPAWLVKESPQEEDLLTGAAVSNRGTVAGRPPFSLLAASPVLRNASPLDPTPPNWASLFAARGAKGKKGEAAAKGSDAVPARVERPQAAKTPATTTAEADNRSETTVDRRSDGSGVAPAGSSPGHSETTRLENRTDVDRRTDAPAPAEPAQSVESAAADAQTSTATSAASTSMGETADGDREEGAALQTRQGDDGAYEVVPARDGSRGDELGRGASVGRPGYLEPGSPDGGGNDGLYSPAEAVLTGAGIIAALHQAVALRPGGADGGGRDSSGDDTSSEGFRRRNNGDLRDPNDGAGQREWQSPYGPEQEQTIRAIAQAFGLGRAARWETVPVLEEKIIRLIDTALQQGALHGSVNFPYRPPAGANDIGSPEGRRVLAYTLKVAVDRAARGLPPDQNGGMSKLFADLGLGPEPRIMTGSRHPHPGHRKWYPAADGSLKNHRRRLHNETRSGNSQKADQARKRLLVLGQLSRRELKNMLRFHGHTRKSALWSEQGKRIAAEVRARRRKARLLWRTASEIGARMIRGGD